MGLESVNYQCPACGGPLRYDGGKGLLVCDHCDSEFPVGQIEELYAQKQAKEESKAADAVAAAQLDADAASGLGDTYVCSSCGAELVADETTAVSECPYCGNPVVRAAQLSGSFAPDLVIPFKLDHKAAVDAPQNHYRGKVLLPKSFREGNHVEEVQGVYVPFWLYDATAEGDAHYDAEKRRTHWEDDDEVVETDHYDVDRSGYMSFARVPVDGSSKMPDGHMDAIEPFDYGELVPFSVAYMPGYLANRWDEDATACRERAEGRIRQSVNDVLRGTVTGYDSVSCVDCAVQTSWQGEKYAMLPVWMLHTKWQDKDFLFAMNGQTGRLVGDLPVSRPKLIGILGAVFASLLAVMWLALGGSAAFSGEDATANVVFLVGVPLIAAAIAAFVLLGQMHTAVEASEASAFLDHGSFELTGRSDRFTHTTTQRIHHERKKE